jgi:hypothetical protein
MIDGQGSKPFSAKTLDPIAKPPVSFAQAVVAHSRATYAKPKHVVEEEVNEFYKLLAKPPVKKKEDEGERQVKVREIKNDTPLPQKRFDNDKKSQSQRKEQSHNRDRESNKDERRDQRKNVDQVVERPHFDAAPAVSLKDALAKAMQEADIEQKKKEDTKSTKDDTPPKEISEDLLRKLLED